LTLPLYVNVTIVSLGIGVHFMNFVYTFRFVRRRKAKGWKISTIQWPLLALLLGPLVWVFWILSVKCYPEQYRDPPPIDTSPLLSTKSKTQYPKGSNIRIDRKEIKNTSSSVASGGFGTVFQGEWLGSLVAVKEISDTGHLSDADIKNFHKEANIMKQVSSEHCVKLLGTCEPPDKLALVMEWMDGGNLHQALGNEEIMPMHKKISVLRQVSAALAHLHANNPPIVHGDIKSLNVMLSDKDCNYDVKLADFGLSMIRDISSRSRASSSYQKGPKTSAAGGTFCYMSPEMLIDSFPSSTASDMWAFGMLMFETITGKRPWAGLQSVQVIEQLKQQKRPAFDMQKVPEGVSEDVYHILLDIMFNCVKQHPHARMAAAEVATKLAAIDENNPAKQTELLLFERGFQSTFSSLEQCLQSVFPTGQDVGPCCQAVQQHLRRPDVSQFVMTHHLSPLEASCIIAYTWNPKPNSPHQYCPYKQFNKACRLRETADIEKWKHFSFHFLNGLRYFVVMCAQSTFHQFSFAQEASK
jgi:serine/threonine protein kinase